MGSTIGRSANNAGRAAHPEPGAAPDPRPVVAPPPTRTGPLEIDGLILGLRRRLDAAGHPGMIETVPGRGHRLVAAPGDRRVTAGDVVLVVDDDEAIRATVRDALEMDGYRVVTAGDGAAGLAALTHAAPCLVLLDMRMPTMDGWEFNKRYRAGGARLAPVVVMTAAENARRWCDEIGGDGCLAKPFDLDALYAVVERFCGTAA